ncbi:MAG: phosphoribosylaminoimidazole-succinocarboxamide synthase [Planctomycetaceae bacterium]|nr:MAG: phosphoribosylaminoimidazole-succinocarboxamide synthase [Planctomycetaceae bacterium]
MRQEGEPLVDHDDSVLWRSELPGYPVRRGKVRDVYDLGDRLLIVATDRLSAFDWILPTPIPEKGRILTQLSKFWFQRVGVPHHDLPDDWSDLIPEGGTPREQLRGRTMLVQKTRVFPVECVVRGYLAGSGWKEYQHTGSVCGIPLPAGLVEASRLPTPIFTPATKAEQGHDENITLADMEALIGPARAEELQTLSLQVYSRAADYAAERGLLLADTKFEFGEHQGRVLLIDEVLTPDSSRFWPAEGYRPGQVPPSFDKQYVRDWLEHSGWDKHSPPPPLPDDVVQRTREKYQEAYERLTGRSWPPATFD